MSEELTVTNQELAPAEELRKCNLCLQLLPLSSFWNRLGELTYRCKECLNKHRSDGNKYKRVLEYKSWWSAMQRCYDESCEAYVYYGGRGITVEEHWHDFNNFYVDMGPKPQKRYTLERIDNNGNYCRSNCKWTTFKEQISNRRNSLNFEIDGVVKSLGDWCLERGVKYHTVHNRIKKGIDISVALSIGILNDTRFKKRVKPDLVAD